MMCLSYSFTFQRTISYLLIAVLIITAVLAEILGTGAARAAGAQARFDIQPTFFSHYDARPRVYFVYNSYPTAVIQDSLHVKNVGTAQGTVHLYPVDATTGQNSGTAFLSPHDSQHDVGAWITLSLQQITLNPGQSEDIPFRLSIPNHIRPGQHGGGILAENVTPQAPFAKSGSIQTALQIRSQEVLGVLVNLPGPLVEKLNAMRITYDTKSTYQRLLVGLDNTGTQLLHPLGNLQIINAEGRKLQNVFLHLDTILPQTSINYPVYIHHTALDPGTYTARLNLSYEHHHSLIYTASIVVPIPQLQTNTTIPRVISDLVTPRTDFFRTLTPWHYIAGISILFLLLSTLFFWSRKLYNSIANLRQSFEDRKTKY